jgi:ribonuclease Z
MRYMILGAGSGLPDLETHQSSIVVQTANANFLLDCGEGVSKCLLRHSFNGNFIDAILISHFHPDHVTGLFMLLQMFYLEGRTKPLRLFLPERPAAILDTMHLFYTFEQRFPFTLKIHDVTELDLYYDNVSPALTDHLSGYADFITSQHYLNPMQSYCFSISEAGKTLLYTADIATFNNLQHVLDRADQIIADALHPAAELIMSLLDYKADKIILTHGVSAALKDWLQHNPHPRFEFAQESVTYQL